MIGFGNDEDRGYILQAVSPEARYRCHNTAADVDNADRDQTLLRLENGVSGQCGGKVVAGCYGSQRHTCPVAMEGQKTVIQAEVIERLSCRYICCRERKRKKLDLGASNVIVEL